MMAKVIPIGQPVNDAERKAIGFLRDRLPDGSCETSVGRIFV